jgi:hypothetical protein
VLVGKAPTGRSSSLPPRSVYLFDTLGKSDVWK